MSDLTILNSYEDIPLNIREKIEELLVEDIILRFNNSSYHDEDIIHNTLEEYGYKLNDSIPDIKL